MGLQEFHFPNPTMHVARGLPNGFSFLTWYFQFLRLHFVTPPTHSGLLLIILLSSLTWEHIGMEMKGRAESLCWSTSPWGWVFGRPG